MIENPYPNWFNSLAVKNFAVVLLKEFRKDESLRFLQIGAYTGDASRWMLDHVLGPQGLLVDVDTWEGSDEPAHHEMDFKHVEEIYDDAIMENYTNVVKCKMTSADYLMKAPAEKFDFIYIDGDHTSAQVMEDAILAWRALKPGGIMAFDDYEWRVAGKSLIETPAPAIDFFLILRGESAEKIWVPENYQVWIRKVGTVDKK